MLPVLELPLGRVLFAASPLLSDDADAPRFGRGRYDDGSWWIEVRLFGLVLGIYR